MSTRDRAENLLLEKLAELEGDLDRVAKQQQAAGDSALRDGGSFPHSYFDCAAEHRQAASWIESLREFITACGLLDQLDAEDEASREAAAADDGNRIWHEARLTELAQAEATELLPEPLAMNAAERAADKVVENEPCGCGCESPAPVDNVFSRVARRCDEIVEELAAVLGETESGGAK